MQLHELLSILKEENGRDPQKTGSGFTACCPAHDDSNPSLSIAEGNDGKILLKCFSGCSIEDICLALGINTSDLFSSMLDQRQSSTKTTYSYKNEDGKELYRKVRIEPGFDGRSKSFYSERTEETGVVVRNLKGCKKVLYRLPELKRGIVEQKTIYLVEGEKDVERLFQGGLIATTSSESSTWIDEFTLILKEADVVILYDMDKAGVERKGLLCQKLYGQVRRLRVLDLPELEYTDSHGKDVTDWLARGHTISELLDITEQAADYLPPLLPGKIRAINLREFLDMQLPKREMLLSPFLPSQGLVMIYAKRGVGKTHIALGIAWAVASGGCFLKWVAPKIKKVLFIDGEMPGSTIQERLQRIAASDVSGEIALDNLRLITPDLQGGPMPDLSMKEGRASIEEFVVDSDLIIVDNISSLFRSGIENDADSWQPAQDWALELRRRGKSILFVHHAGKNGSSRGSSKREDILDAVICLKNPSGYRSDQGAKFEVVFEKTRHFAGEDAASFQVELCELKDGLWDWKVSNLETDSLLMKVVDLFKEGSTLKEIQEKTGLSKSQVETKKKKAKEQGLLDDEI